MGFLDNSGDIILDAVLTDTGRMRLAKGDGSFKIVKFALGDDEIDYTTYNSGHTSGSAYYDLEILQTPVFEAFTNNRSSMKSKLVSYDRNDLLYLPRIEWWYNAKTEADAGGANFSGKIINVVVNEETKKHIGSVSAPAYMNPSNGPLALLEQGLVTTELSFKETLQSDLVETQYIIEMDHRLGRLTKGIGTQKFSTGPDPSFIDDDQIASYFLSSGVDNDFIKVEKSYSGRIALLKDQNATKANGPILGPLGTALYFFIRASINLQSSTFYFEKLGRSTTMANVTSGATVNIYELDSTIKIVGATTGFSVEIPVRYIRKRD